MRGGGGVMCGACSFHAAPRPQGGYLPYPYRSLTGEYRMLLITKYVSSSTKSNHLNGRHVALACDTAGIQRCSL